MFRSSKDEFILDQLRRQFAIINEVAVMPNKDVAKNAKCCPPSGAVSVNIMFFIHAFREAQERCLLSAIEEAMGLEVEALVNGW